MPFLFPSGLLQCCFSPFVLYISFYLSYNSDLGCSHLLRSFCSLYFVLYLMEKTKRPQIPSFGDWNYYTEVPVKQPGDLGKKGGLERHYTKRSANVKQRKEVRRSGDVAVNPVDGDLYKIPPELLYEKPRRRSFVWSWLTGCIGLSC